MWFHRAVSVVVYVAWALAGLSVVMLFAYPRSSSTPSASGQEGPTTTLAANLVSAGEPVYDARCATCHGADGGGGIGPALAGRVVAAFPTMADQVAVVRDGQGGMPDFGDVLTTEEIDAVVAYTRSLD